MKTITSLSNPLIKAWKKLDTKKGRREAKEFLIEGEHLIEEALKSGCVKHILLLEGLHHPFCAKEQAIQVSQKVLDELSSTNSKAQMMAVCSIVEQHVQTRNKVVLLDGVQDPGNLGTIVRTAVSFGYDQVILSKECVDLYNEKVVRSTQGALFAISVITRDLVEEIHALKQEGFFVYGTSLHEAVFLKDRKKTQRCALVLGNEGAGVSEQVLAECNQNLMIEMDQFESLNVAVAAGIAMYTLRYE
ncbi:MAG: RNA methyltransferase [Erysipelotrichaceae bacterium]|nr:RNA methyltransferase [Erysipelotrichaceae bacterium]